MSHSELFVVATAIILGATSLYALLTLIRHRFPTVFTPETKKLHRVIKTQSALEDVVALQVEQGSSKRLLSNREPPPSTTARTGQLTVRKLLKYAKWKISPTLFHTISALISMIIFILCAPYCNLVIHALCLISGPVIMRSVLTRCVERRGNRFDADYPQFLMSMVGLLKTGLTPSGALEAAAQGLDANSLVRQEILLMLERVRLGILEETSIGSFGEDILHPEIELFVQALLLSNRIGGNLSESLERLSKQVRKRQHFKSSAQAAVALQRGSLKVIIVILVLLEGYIGVIFPELILNGLKSAVGWHIWQICVACIIVALFWARQVTKLKI